MCVACVFGLGILFSIMGVWWMSWLVLPPVLGLTLVLGYFVLEKKGQGEKFVFKKSAKKLLKTFKLCCQDS